MTTPLRAALFVAHIAAAVVSYGALGATGAFARSGRRGADPFGSESLRRFFRPGHNLASRALYLVPLLGAGLLVTGPQSDLTEVFPWIGLGLWTVSVGIAMALVWPNEGAVQQLLAEEQTSVALCELRQRCRRIERSAIALTGCFLGAFAIMVIQ